MMTSGVGGSNGAEQLSGLGPWPDAAPAIGADEREARLARARALMEESGLDALLVGAGASLRYFAGIGWSASERLVAMLLPRNGEPVIVGPHFERDSLSAELAIEAGVATWQEDEPPADLVVRTLRQMGASRVGLDPAMAYRTFEPIRRAARSFDLVDGAGIIDGCRMHKSEAELALIRQAMAMTLEVQRRAALILREGIAASEVCLFVDSAHRALGAAGSSFCIVQFGRSTAYPHGLPGECHLRENDMVLIDAGCTVDGYNSDITRSYVFGRPSEEQRSIFALEQEAQQAAFEAALPGVPCEEVDAAARRVVARAGLGPDYRLPGMPHRTGHGIGLSVHEPAYLVRGDRTPLAPGMCFSNEPMIVVPERFGIRLEDHFHVTGEGAAWFTRPAASIDDPFGDAMPVLGLPTAAMAGERR
jgi:Xaa-Pro dipeptidase